jgi:alkanesulfonate monooxygenase SsuD/methylene tetrahydromethanopterin reductase-like flavin-dependent oxidoreductase (luciferase family)
MDCNRGKGGKPIQRLAENAADADFEYLKSEQSRLEVERYLESVDRRNDAMRRAIEALRRKWVAAFDDLVEYSPTDREFEYWINTYGPNLAERAIQALTPAVMQGKLTCRSANGAERAVRYVSAVMRNMVERGDV